MSVDKLYNKINQLPPDLQKDLFKRLHVKKIRRTSKGSRATVGQILKEGSEQLYTTSVRIKRSFWGGPKVKSAGRGLEGLRPEKVYKLDELVGIADGPKGNGSQTYRTDLYGDRRPL